MTEKDADAAYLLFSFPAPELEQKSAHGSIEVVQTERSVRLLVSLPQLPAYRFVHARQPCTSAIRPVTRSPA